MIFGFATAFEVPARQAFLVELVPAEDLVSAAAINSTTYNLARVVGPAIAGILVAAAGPGAAFAVNARELRRGADRSVADREESMSRRCSPSASRSSPACGSSRARPVLTALAWQMVLLTVFAGSFIPILAVYAQRGRCRSAPPATALLTSAVGVGAAIGAIGIGGDEQPVHPRPRVALSSASTALGDGGDPAGAGSRPHAGAGAPGVRRGGDGEPGHRDRHRPAAGGALRAARTGHGGLFVRRARAGAARRIPGRLCRRTSRRAVEHRHQRRDLPRRHGGPAPPSLVQPGGIHADHHLARIRRRRFVGRATRWPSAWAGGWSTISWSRRSPAAPA